MSAEEQLCSKQEQLLLRWQRDLRQQKFLRFYLRTVPAQQRSLNADQWGSCLKAGEGDAVLLGTSCADYLLCPYQLCDGTGFWAGQEKRAAGTGDAMSQNHAAAFVIQNQKLPEFLIQKRRRVGKAEIGGKQRPEFSGCVVISGFRSNHPFWQ